MGKLGNLMQRNRTVETSLCLFGFISSFSLPVVFQLASSRYIFLIFFLFVIW